MAIPFIQIGQCGNQIGQSFYNTMFQEALTATPSHQALLEPFFRQSNTAKALLIDMEPKVVNKCLTKKGHWNYDDKLSLVRQQGSGNNWAYGCCLHGPKVRDDIQQILRRVSQPEDYINSFVQLQSLAGGTGSGLGTYNFTLLDQLYPKVPKVVICILPHLSGQVILQSYNASLSLGTICDLADGVFIIQNDEINKICEQLMNIKKPQLQNMNNVISRSLASMMFPVVPKDMTSVHSLEQSPFNFGRQITEEIFYDNRYKIASIKCAPFCQKNYENFNSDSWQSIQNQLQSKCKPYKSKVFIGRGIDPPQNKKKVRSFYDKHCFFGYNKSGTMIENGLTSISSLETILQRAYGMLKSKAFLYQYEKYHVNAQTFMEYLAVMQQIQTNYNQLK